MPTRIPANGEIVVFQSDRDGDYEIFAVNGNGTAQIRLTDNSVSDSEPVLSPDRKRIAFASSRGGTNDIFLMNADGTNVVRLSSDARQDGQPGWSPDGTRIAWSSEDEDTASSDIVIFDLQTRTRRKLTDDGPGVTNSEPAWHPDGRRIAYASTLSFEGNPNGFTQILSRPASGGDITPLTFADTFHSAPAWSPDGTRLAFVADLFDESSRAFLSEAVGFRPRLALDLGCGPGHTTRLLAEVLRPGRVVGVDRSVNLL